jgi:transcriptional regulator with XRE-family HTH domain
MNEQWKLDLIEELKDIEFAKSYGAEDAKSEFGLCLLRARKAANMTQQQFSKKLGVNQSYIAQLESGEANPTLSTAGKMMAVLGLRIKISNEPLVPRVETSTYLNLDANENSPYQNRDFRIFTEGAAEVFSKNRQIDNSLVFNAN